MEDKLSLSDDNYEVSESEDDYTPRERKLLRKVKEGRKNLDESNVDEVLRFDDDESDVSDDEPEKFEADSDFDDPAAENEDYLPDSRAWGKKRQNFYNTDFHDNDYSTYTEKEEEIAILEQKEALEIQKRLASELNESDFNLDLFNLPTSTFDDTHSETRVKKTTTDLSDLSKKQKLALLRTEAPEFEGLVQDFHERMTEAKDQLMPVLKLINSIKDKVPKHPFVDFIKCRLKLILDYCTNISFYLMLKSKRFKVKNHPIVKRLVQFRQLITQLDDIFEYVIQSQIHNIITLSKEIVDPNELNLKLMEMLKPKLTIDEQSDEGLDEMIDEPLFSGNHDDEDEKEKSIEQMETEENDEEGVQKRKISRQIAKNKGLTASKRRELRNPRVKNKLKFTKAVKRRKGAVQPIRSKVEAYGGEITGIKTHVKRSIKIK